MSASGKRRAIIIGASGAIGGAIARRLAHDGIRLTVFGRNARTLQRLRRELAPLVEATFSVDLREHQAASAQFALALRGRDRIENLVLAAGVGVASLSPPRHWQSWFDMLATNLAAPACIAFEFARYLRRRGITGRIAFVSSASALAPRTGGRLYAASHYGALLAADEVRAYLRRAGNASTVSAVLAGLTASRLSRDFLNHTAAPKPRKRPCLHPAAVANAVAMALTAAPEVEMRRILVTHQGQT